MRVAFTAFVLISLGACTQIPDSGAGVGFDNSLTDERARQALLQDRAPQTQPQGVAVPAGALSTEQTAPSAGGAIQRPAGSAPLSAPGLAPATAAVPPAAPVATSAVPPAQDDAILEAAAALEQRQANSGQAPLQASPSNPAPQIIGNPGLSDENDFQAVSQRESIESDAERIAQNQAQYQLVQPTAVPTRNGTTQPNIVEYALETRHPVGTRLYNRVGLNMAARSRRNCADFASADLAQIDFLANGGPRRDRKALDPDGDGYACGWNPAPYRAAAQN